MPNRFAIALAVAGLCGGWPVFAAEMPAYGTKNFTPGGDAPAYFTHNPAAPTVKSEDWSTADAAAGPVAAAAPARRTASLARHHGKAAVHHRGDQRTAGKSTSRGHAHHLAAAKSGKTARAASLRQAKPSASAGKARAAARASDATRHAAARSPQRKG